jgi:hypothetical protein
MPQYRIFVIGDHGRFVKSVELDGADEANAIYKARLIAEERAFELWQRDQKIAKFDVKTN